ncbi:iron chelate uptake ABC transporter family permease subunit [Bacillus licheniformis]|nr:iron chelate uptake ABC transporter family permease subunit [Bacillus licheniformis]
MLFIFYLCPLTAGAVSIVGAIGFIGLIGPHIAKLDRWRGCEKSPIISKSIKEFRLGSFHL